MSPPMKHNPKKLNLVSTPPLGVFNSVRPPEDEDIPKENERIGLSDVGVFDSDIYGASGKKKFEGYLDSIATGEEEDEDDGVAPEKRGGQRASYTAPQAVLNEISKGRNDQEDPFAANKVPTIRDRETDYQKRRSNQQISPARVDFFADGGKTPEVGSRGYADIMREQSLKSQEADFKKQIAACVPLKVWFLILKVHLILLDDLEGNL